MCDEKKKKLKLKNKYHRINNRLLKLNSNLQVF